MKGVPMFMSVLKRETIERIHVTAPIEKSNEMLDYLYNNNWHPTTSGPRMISLTRFDPTRFEVWAERIKYEEEL